MKISRAGYYKWKNRGRTKRQVHQEEAISIVKEVHSRHPSHGYRWVAAYIKINAGITLSDNYVYKAFRYLGIKSQTKHKVRSRPRKVKDKYPNLIFTAWDLVDRPRQVIVSDMMTLRFSGYHYEITLYFDVFTKQILSWRLAERRGSRNQYIEGVQDIVEMLRDHREPTILHTDQGSVYASIAYNELIKDTNIVRSMSRAGKPTDNPVNEALNGWIKEELHVDFKLGTFMTREKLHETLEGYVKFYNSQRPCFALGYDTPDNYYERYKNGEIVHKDTFSKRTLSGEPKFVQKRKSKKQKTPG